MRGTTFAALALLCSGCLKPRTCLELYTCPPDGERSDAASEVSDGSDRGRDAGPLDKTLDVEGGLTSVPYSTSPSASVLSDQTGEIDSLTDASVSSNTLEGGTKSEDTDSGRHNSCQAFATQTGELRVGAPQALLPTAATSSLRALSVTYAAELDTYAINYQLGEEVYFSTVNARGAVVTPPLALGIYGSSEFTKRNLQLAWDGSQFVGLVQVESADSNRLVLVTIDAEGSVTSQDVWTSSFESAWGYRIAYATGTWLFWHGSGSGADSVAQRASQDLLPLGSPTVLPAVSGEIGVKAFDGNVLVTWTTTESVELQSLTAESGLRAITALRDANATAPTLDRHGDVVSLAWQRSNYQIRHSRIEVNSGELLCGPKALDAEARQLAGLVSAGSEDLVVTTKSPTGSSLSDLDYEAEAFVVDANCVTSAPIPIAVAKGLPRIAHSESTALLGWVEKQDESTWQVRYQIVEIEPCD